MGVDIAKAAIASGHRVVATARDKDAVAAAVGEADDLLVLELDITSLASAAVAVEAAVARFGLLAGRPRAIDRVRGGGVRTPSEPFLACG